MATTVEKVTRQALQRILVQASEAEMQASEYQDAIDALNNMMAAWEANGIRLGYTPVNSLSDTVTVAPGAIRGIIANLAVEVAPDYDGTVTPALATQAAAGLDTCRKLGRVSISSQFPSTLPRGSGSRSDVNTGAFFTPYDLGGTYHGTKDPQSVEQFPINWADLLDRIGDTISTSSWAADSGVVLDSDSNTTTTTAATVSAGNLDAVCRLVNTITTAGGLTFERTWVIEIRDD